MRKDDVIWKAMTKSATKMEGLKEKAEGFFCITEKYCSQLAQQGM